MTNRLANSLINRSLIAAPGCTLDGYNSGCLTVIPKEMADRLTSRLVSKDSISAPGCTEDGYDTNCFITIRVVTRYMGTRM